MDLLVFKRSLKRLLATAAEQAFPLLEKVLQEDSSLYNEFIQLQGRHQAANSDFRKNLITLKEKDLSVDRVRAAMIGMVDEMGSEDLKSGILEQAEIQEFFTQHAIDPDEPETGFLQRLGNFVKAHPLRSGLLGLLLIILASSPFLIRNSSQNGHQELPPTDSLKIRGNILAEQGVPLSNGLVDIEGFRTHTDSLGDFQVKVPLSPGKLGRVRVFIRDSMIYSGTETLSETWFQIKLK